MLHDRDIYWLAPVSMLAALLAGIAFAAGHHAFYNYLNDREVPSGDYSMNVSKQQTNAALGTAFAFAVKTCLVLAVSTAYVQIFWKHLTARSTGQPLTLKNVDKSYSALRNALLLVDIPGWRSFPLLFTMALTAWLVC
jgi:hypothetical protein